MCVVRRYVLGLLSGRRLMLLIHWWWNRVRSLIRRMLVLNLGGLLMGLLVNNARGSREMLWGWLPLRVMRMMLHGRHGH